MPPPPPSPLLFRSSLHPVRGAPLFSLSRQPAVNALSLSCQNASIPLSLSCSPASLQHLPLSRPLSTTLSCHSGDHHGVHYDPPQGWLFGIPPGQKYEKEGWEGLWVWGFWGSLIFGVVGYAYKPDTSYVFSLSLSFFVSTHISRSPLLGR